MQVVMVQFLSIFFFLLGFIQFLLSFLKVPVFFVSFCTYVCVCVCVCVYIYIYIYIYICTHTHTHTHAHTNVRAVNKCGCGPLVTGWRGAGWPPTVLTTNYMKSCPFARHEGLCGCIVPFILNAVTI